MSHTRFRFLASLGTLGSFAAGAFVLVACAAKVAPSGTGNSQAQAVAPSEVAGTVLPCNAGMAHPNVCCEAGPGKASACFVTPGTPFAACSAGAATYPDPRSCCPLDSTGACVIPPPPPPIDGGPATDGGTGGGGGCHYGCPPGWYPPATDPSGTVCCEQGPNGTEVCEASAGGSTVGSVGTPSAGGNPSGGAGGGGGPSTGGGSSGGPSVDAGSCGVVCACPACPVNGPCPPCACPPPSPTCPPPPPPPPVCDACPPGWQVPLGDPELCCREVGEDIIECFSQAGPPPPPPPPPLDGGMADGSPPPPPPIDAGPGPVGCFGSSSGACGCDEQLAGHDYQVNCDPTVGTCECVVDGAPATSSFPYKAGVCGDPTTLFALCGFPKG